MVSYGFMDRPGRVRGWLSAGMWARSTEALSLRDCGQAFAVGALVGAGCCCGRTRGPADGDRGSMLRAFVEYERLHHYVPTVLGRRPTLQEPALEQWRRRYPLFPPDPIRPGRHRTCRCRQPDQRPARGGRAAGAVPLRIRRPRPSSPAGRPPPPRPLRTRMAPPPRSRPDG
jgi:hypothetical protein